MKPCCRILLSCKNSSIFGYSFPKCDHSRFHNLSKTQFKVYGSRGFSSCSNKILGFRFVIDPKQKAFSGSGSNWGQPRVFTSGCHVNRGGRSVVGIVNVASDFRNHSTSAEAHVNEKSFERIYIQGGLNVKPLVIDRVERESHLRKEEREEEYRVEVNGPKVNVDNSKGLNGSKVLTNEREVSEIEKEAWKLLRGAIVDYCGKPVGTVAASDPADKIPLNYDQVFIRDFVPSALAFLLNGEGEIVKNFLLNTLQLQVFINTTLALSYLTLWFPN